MINRTDDKSEIAEFIKRASNSGTPAAMLTNEVAKEDVSNYGIVVTRTEGDLELYEKIVEKPKPEEIMSPYAASIMFIFPPQIWDYVTKLEPSPRGEIEMQSAVQHMIEDGYKAYGVLQPAPDEWDAVRHHKHMP